MEFYNNWYEEKRSAYLYSIIAKYETNILRKKLFSELQRAAEKQAAIWEVKLTSKSDFVPDRKTRLVSLLIKFLGADRIHNILSAMKIRGMSVFNQYHPEKKHTSSNAISNLRAAIFGMNDGLISNVSLILGVSGANVNEHYIILTGIAGLLAGASSMAAGEYVSVKSQREVFEYQIAIEKQELEEYPEEEAEELNLIYQARGLPKEEAKKLAEFMVSNPKTGLDALAREELGLNPDDLVSPFGAMCASFFSFAIGAFIPLLPFFFLSRFSGLALSVTITAISLFLIGTILSLFTNRHPILLGLRMLGIGALAGTVTYLIGHWYSG